MDIGKRMEKISVAFLCLMAVVALVFFIFFRHSSDIGVVVLGGKQFMVEIAGTKSAQEKGLSGRAVLPDDQGMLFIFDAPGKYGFWMKDMLFPLDIVWMDSNWRIIHIEHSLATSTYPSIFGPKSDSQFVLEIPAGQAGLLGLKEGDFAEFQKK